MRPPRTLGSLAAATFLGISPQLLSYRARLGKIRLARHRPLRFRFQDIIEARERMQVKDRRGRKTALIKTMEEILS